MILEICSQAHQLITLAEEDQEQGEAAKEALFRATYEEGQNVSDDSVLHQVTSFCFPLSSPSPLPSSCARFSCPAAHLPLEAS